MHASLLLKALTKLPLLGNPPPNNTLTPTHGRIGSSSNWDRGERRGGPNLFTAGEGLAATLGKVLARDDLERCALARTDALATARDLTRADER